LAPLLAAGAAAAPLQAPRVDAPTLPCVMNVTVEGCDGEAVIVLVTVFVAVIIPGEGGDGGGPWPMFAFKSRECSNVC
jgi:hypothetical protein